MIIIHAHITVDPAKRDVFLEKTKEVIKGSQAEEGNISYDLFESAGKENSFVMLEKWKDKEAVRLHGETAHFQNYMQEMKEVLAAPLKAERFEAEEL
ncbi:putative quinol monooxygenase [Bacillus infantis]|jgi:quinol monooxygenase YgiN|uniref:putative quinol monooxygenase n=1 Tax=Bacillus infantis TaxID=324767 RepID=UPI002155D007|nr:putative quinol monooxygenase [Bacillus infantis]MCR6611465.1 antibiotic biosynthesis monooxygenase [Bacillus infantis]